jgi:hypothetical protein
MTWVSQLAARYPNWPELALAVLASLAVSYATGEVAARTARWVFLTLSGSGDPADFRSPIVRRSVRIIRLVVTMGIAALLTAPTLRLAGAPVAVGIAPRVLGDWLLGTGLRVVTCSSRCGAWSDG